VCYWFLSPLKSNALCRVWTSELGSNGKHANHYTTNDDCLKVCQLKSCAWSCSYEQQAIKLIQEVKHVCTPTKPSHFRSVSLLQWHLPVSEIVRHLRDHLRPPISNYRYVLSNVHGHISMFIPDARDAEDKRLITWVQCLLCKVCKLTHWHRVRHKLIIAVCLEFDLIGRNKHVSLCHVSRWPLNRGGLGSHPGQSMWDLWTKWHSGRFLRVIRFPLSISFHRCCPYVYITWGMNNRPVGGRSSET
jgi:hypothetical protein